MKKPKSPASGIRELCPRTTVKFVETANAWSQKETKTFFFILVDRINYTFAFDWQCEQHIRSYWPKHIVRNFHPTTEFTNLTRKANT